MIKGKIKLALVILGSTLFITSCTSIPRPEPRTSPRIIENKESDYKLNLGASSSEGINETMQEIKTKIIATPRITITPEKKIEPSKSISLDKFKNLDLSTQSWYVIRNSEHKLPKINVDIKKMTEKFDAYYCIQPDIKKVYLTFDEGYENGYTESILDTLKSKNIKASFFITGQYLKVQKKLVKRMLEDGHGVENHTMNHPSLQTLNGKQFQAEVEGLQKIFKEEFGIEMKYLRPPKGEYNEKVLSMIKELGYKTAFWSFAYDDYDVNKQRGSSYAYKMIMDNVHSGEIMLLHAVSKDNASVLPQIIDEIQEKGYEIGKLE